MPDQDDDFRVKSFQYFQKMVRRSGPAATASYTLVGAVLLLGGIGHLVDGWLETSPWVLLAGLLVGIAVGFYELVKTAWK